MGDITGIAGPDDEGMHVDGACAHRHAPAVDHRRGGGHQPLSNADGTLWLVCNGEIYNFRELRRELRGAAATRFNTAFGQRGAAARAMRELGRRRS